MDLKKFLLPTQKSKNQTTEYILRGMIVYYGKHYVAYFYSERFDAWFLFDDTKVRWIGNFIDVSQRCISK